MSHSLHTLLYSWDVNHSICDMHVHQHNLTPHVVHIQFVNQEIFWLRFGVHAHKLICTGYPHGMIYNYVDV